MKLTVLGGGSVRSVFLVQVLAQQADRYGISEVVLMDIDEKKLEYFGKLAAAVGNAINKSLQVNISTNAVEALSDADYVISTLRVGGDQTRVEDEKIARSLGLIAQETSGACGFSFAMRTIPVLHHYCEVMRKYAKKDAILFNFTNPVGLVTQALHDAGFTQQFGICDAPTSFLQQVAKLFMVPLNELDMYCHGLNHLSFFSKIFINGQDKTKEVQNHPELHILTDQRLFSPELINKSQCFFNEYLYYYYYRDIALYNILNAKETRGEEILRINSAMLNDLAALESSDFEKRLEVFSYWYGERENSYMSAESGQKRKSKWTFSLNEKEEGGYAGVALQYIRIKQSGGLGRMILAVPNEGAIPFLENQDVVEVSGLVDSSGFKADPCTELPGHAKELIRRVKYYERLGAKAILNKNWNLAVEALQWHPLIESYHLAKQLLDQFIVLNSLYLE